MLYLCYPSNVRAFAFFGGQPRTIALSGRHRLAELEQILYFFPLLGVHLSYVYEINSRIN